MRQLYSHIILFLLFLFVASHLEAQPFPKVDTNRQVTMRGTFYHDRFVGRKTSSGEIFSQDKFTAAHHSYKFGTLLLVTNPTNGKQVIVRVNDRCPKSNILDMTRRAATLIGIKSRMVKVLVLPDSYMPLWESQERFLDALEQGCFLRHAQAGIASLEELCADKALFNVELFCSPTRESAEKMTERLPLCYRESLVVKTKRDSCPVTAVLELSLPHDKAESLVKELLPFFPSAKAVKVD